MQSTTNITLDLQQPNVAVTADAKQNDLMSRVIVAQLKDGSAEWTVPGGASAFIRYKKPDGTGGFYDTMEDNTTPAYSVSGSTITFILCEQMTTVPGSVYVEINFYTGTEKLTSFCFLLRVQASVLDDATIVSSDYYNVMTATLAQMAAIAANLPVPSTSTPLADSGSGVIGSAVGYARGDHQHPLNVPGSGTPASLGTADNGSASTYARSDHVHAMPSSSDVGAVPAADVQYKIYDSVTDVGLDSGSATISGAWAALRAAAPAMLVCPSSNFASAQLPEGSQYGTITIAVAYSDLSNARGWVEFHGYGSGVGDYRMFLSSSTPSGTWVYASVNWKLMWTNSSPSSDYSSGTIPLDLSAFSEVMIVFNTTTSSTYTTTLVTPIDGTSSLMYCVTALASSTAMSLAGRYVSATSTGVTINAARVKPFSSTAAGTTDNSYFIPYKIYAR